MTPEQIEALEAVVEWMHRQSIAAATIAARDSSQLERQRAHGRSCAHLTCANHLRGVLAGLR